MQQRVEELPGEQIIRAQTLGASTVSLVLRVVLPQVLPRLLDAPRLSLVRPAVPDCCRGYRRYRGPGLPHLSGAALSGDGCHPALCGPITVLVTRTGACAP